MFKILFSNILDNELYGLNKFDKKSRSGKQIKHDIMSCINALTLMGIQDINDKFFKDGRVNDKAVHHLIQTIIRNNGLGSSAQEIVDRGGVVASLMSRKVFEQSVSAAVNRDVVDINTKGGSAIQQSIFGFVGYNNKNVIGATTVDENGNVVKNKEYNKYRAYNEGKELKWNKKNGSMEVLLSMNFFKAVVPKEFQDTYVRMRQWLIDNDVIKGTKTNGEISKPKPFGIGYRIPTQGMSSTFAFTVADVLPE
ncbi:hypothetical protein [Sharpea azabuensis]|uniref:hypothetical protein n=1 Tax=Sharpea azabuensis TaxID=322505 RepID=UPI00156910A9|nr:hypothetical protein [Sharpea azabuensis]